MFHRIMRFDQWFVSLRKTVNTPLFLLLFFFFKKIRFVIPTVLHRYIFTPSPPPVRLKLSLRRCMLLSSPLQKFVVMLSYALINITWIWWYRRLLEQYFWELFFTRFSSMNTPKNSGILFPRTRIRTVRGGSVLGLRIVWYWRVAFFSQ